VHDQEPRKNLLLEEPHLVELLLKNHPLKNPLAVGVEHPTRKNLQVVELAAGELAAQMLEIGAEKAIQGIAEDPKALHASLQAEEMNHPHQQL
jgi:hypothetical protein